MHLYILHSLYCLRSLNSLHSLYNFKSLYSLKGLYSLSYDVLLVKANLHLLVFFFFNFCGTFPFHTFFDMLREYTMQEVLTEQRNDVCFVDKKREKWARGNK